jgi:spore coat protein CotH
MNRARPIICLALLTAVACESDVLQLPAADAGGDTATSVELDESEAAVGALVFEPLRVAKIEIEVGETDRALLRSEATQRINSDNFSYVPITLRFDGEVYEQVGMRVKGNSSRRPSEDNPDAIPYKLDMNKYIDGQKLDGLTKINLHRNASLNEYLSYGAFREAGVAASRTGWADVTLNGVSLGLYTLVEQVDERMLGRYYSDPDGALYKPEPPVGYLNYAGDDIAAYSDPGYKADLDTDHATFLELIKTINQDPVDSWSDIVDVDSVLGYFAGNVALGNWDTYVAMGHNYYLFEQSPGKLVMLPWDLNLSQGSTGVVCPADMRMGGGPGGELRGMRPDGGMPPGGFPEGALPPEGFMPPAGAQGPGPFGGRGEVPLYKHLMENEATFARYRQALSQYLEGSASEAALNSAIDAVVPVLGDRLSTTTLDALREGIATRIAAIEAGLATTTECKTETTTE